MKKKEKKKPLDMTTDEAMAFLFPKKVVSELKHVAKPPENTQKPNRNRGKNVSRG